MQVNLVFLKKDGTTSSFSLPSTVTSIGRRQDCDFCIPLMVVSRKHCEIYMDSGKITVRDMGSRNGTLVNEKPVEETRLKAGDVLKIGPVEFVVQVDGDPASFEEYLQKQEEPQAQPAEALPEGNFDEMMEDLSASNSDLGKSQTELLGDLSEDFDFGEDLSL